MLSEEQYLNLQKSRREKTDRQEEGERLRGKERASRYDTQQNAHKHNTRTLPHARYITRIVSFNVKIK